VSSIGIQSGLAEDASTATALLLTFARYSGREPVESTPLALAEKETETVLDVKNASAPVAPSENEVLNEASAENVSAPVTCSLTEDTKICTPDVTSLPVAESEKLAPND
jgi:hypothetical protein